FLAARRNPRPWIIYAMYAAAALGVLSKGLIGAVLPGMIIFAWLLCTGQWRILQHMRIPSGVLLFLAITVPWHVAAQLRYPQFLEFYFIHEQFTRFSTGVHHRNKPWWFFPVVLLIGLMPWTPLLPAAIKRARRAEARNDYLFLLLWAGLPLVFF